MNILVLNPGSSTLKFAQYQIPESSKASITTDSSIVLASGVIEPIGKPLSELKLTVATQKPIFESVKAATPEKAVEQIIRRVIAFEGQNSKSSTAIDAVGCRVVHGGAKLVEPTLVTASVLEELRALKDLAPLHIPARNCRRCTTRSRSRHLRGSFDDLALPSFQNHAFNGHAQQPLIVVDAQRARHKG